MQQVRIFFEQCSGCIIQKRRTFYTCAILPQMTLFWFLQHYCGPVECEKNRKVPFKVETKCVLLYCISQSLVAKNVKFLTIKKHFIFSQLPKNVY